MDVIAYYRRAAASTAAVLERVPEDQLDAPTPCDRWTIREIVQHMKDNSDGMLDRIGKKSTVDELAASHDEVLAAWDDPEVLDRKFELAGFDIDGRSVVAINFADVLVHGWDIARAAGFDVTFDEDLISAAVKVTSRFPENLRGPDGPFDHPHPVAEDASSRDRMLAYLGRDPEWSAPARQAS